MPCKSAFVCRERLNLRGHVQEKEKKKRCSHCWHAKKFTSLTKKDNQNIQIWRGEKCSTVLSKRTAVFFYSTVGSDAMHQYKPGTAIGSTWGRGSARNQRERLRALPCSTARPALGAKPTSQLIICVWTRPTKVVSAKKVKTSHLFLSYLPRAVWTESPGPTWRRRRWLLPPPRCRAHCGSAHRCCCSRSRRPAPQRRPRRPPSPPSCGGRAKSQVVGVVHYLLAKPLELSQLVYEGVLHTEHCGIRQISTIQWKETKQYNRNIIETYKSHLGMVGRW